MLLDVPAAHCDCRYRAPTQLSGLGWIGQEYVQGAQRWVEVAPGVCELSIWMDVSDGNQAWVSQGQVACPWGAPPPPPSPAPAPAPVPEAVAAPPAPPKPVPAPAPSPASAPAPSPSTVTTVHAGGSTGPSSGAGPEGYLPGDLSLYGDAGGGLIFGGGDASSGGHAQGSSSSWLLFGLLAAGAVLVARRRGRGR